jgi:hypothetical protein
MPRSRSSFIVSAGVMIAATLTAQSALAQPAGRRSPQFVATAVKFKALHETHWNWLGSDEVFAEFYDFVGMDVRKTPTFGDVDAGETRDFSAPASCISLQPNCDRGASSLGFGVALLEEDYAAFPFCHGAVSSGPPTPEGYEADFDALTGACPGADLIGKVKVKLSQADLVAKLPHVGDSVDATVPLTGGDGRYEVTYRLTRLPDRFNIPPIGPFEVLNAISLSATETNASGPPPKPVSLTWAGANTSTVDIYRDGAIIVTTANDGSYDDPRPIGTYQYRLCEQGSATACSAVVAITVI